MLGPMSETFEDHAASVLESIRAGASINDAAHHGGCSTRTVFRWLEKGRAEPLSPYGAFAIAVDRARDEQGLPCAADEEEMTAGDYAASPPAQLEKARCRR